MADFLLYEQASGYALFQVKKKSGDGAESKEALADLGTFGKLVKLVSFAPFKGAAHALENANDLSEGILNDHLKSLLDLNLPKTAKKGRTTLGIQDKNLAASIKSVFPNIDCIVTEDVQDLLRGIRLHAEKLLKQLNPGDVERAQLGLGHAYSRAKVKFNVHKNDNHIIQAIALLDTLDKDINTFSMRVREWYSWHFPELYKLVPDNYKYAKLVLMIRNKDSLNNTREYELAAIVDEDAAVAKSIVDASKISMGQEISAADMENITTFAAHITGLVEYRKTLHEYLSNKMGIVAPNLSELIGEIVGARLISHAGSLTNLSKYPASTVQILGAEKALFRALKTKGNTPKYGLIYHSSFIGRAAQKNKGRISRFLANKCSIASRIDNFADLPTTKFGEVMRKQVEERLEFYETGTPPMKNAEAMKIAMDGILEKVEVVTDEKRPEKSEKKKKRKSEIESDQPQKKSKKDKEKKEKKSKA